MGWLGSNRGLLLEEIEETKRPPFLIVRGTPSIKIFEPTIMFPIPSGHSGTRCLVGAFFSLLPSCIRVFLLSELIRV